MTKYKVFLLFAILIVIAHFFNNTVARLENRTIEIICNTAKGNETIEITGKLKTFELEFKNKMKNFEQKLEVFDESLSSANSDIIRMKEKNRLFSNGMQTFALNQKSLESKINTGTISFNNTFDSLNSSLEILKSKMLDDFFFKNNTTNKLQTLDDIFSSKIEFLNFSHDTKYFELKKKILENEKLIQRNIIQNNYTLILNTISNLRKNLDEKENKDTEIFSSISDTFSNIETRILFSKNKIDSLEKKISKTGDDQFKFHDIVELLKSNYSESLNLHKELEKNISELSNKINSGLSSLKNNQHRLKNETTVSFTQLLNESNKNLANDIKNSKEFKTLRYNSTNLYTEIQKCKDSFSALENSFNMHIKKNEIMLLHLNNTFEEKIKNGSNKIQIIEDECKSRFLNFKTEIEQKIEKGNEKQSENSINFKNSLKQEIEDNKTINLGIFDKKLETEVEKITLQIRETLNQINEDINSRVINLNNDHEQFKEDVRKKYTHLIREINFLKIGFEEEENKNFTEILNEESSPKNCDFKKLVADFLFDIFGLDEDESERKTKPYLLETIEELKKNKTVYLLNEQILPEPRYSKKWKERFYDGCKVQIYFE